MALVTRDENDGITSGWLYSAESQVWSELTSVQHPNVTSVHHQSSGELTNDALTAPRPHLADAPLLQQFSLFLFIFFGQLLAEPKCPTM